mmetsp:Transcript_5593/g.17917  ORF Transcript_5593/g.17917 Transcript_5593/m.17917 type:complete len:138 (-) Transcript_5593:163-576(-)
MQTSTQDGAVFRQRMMPQGATARSPGSVGHALSRGPCWILAFVGLGAGGWWLWMTEKASYDLVQTADRDALIGAAFAFRQIDPCDAGRTGVWTPRFENNSKRCIEDAETRRVFSWYAGAGRSICPRCVNISGCAAEL